MTTATAGSVLADAEEACLLLRVFTTFGVPPFTVWAVFFATFTGGATAGVTVEGFVVTAGIFGACGV